MSLIKYIILSIINSITNLLPISYTSHIYILQNIFNTKIFDNIYINSLLNLSLFTAIIIMFHKQFIKYFLSLLKSFLNKNKSSFKTKSKYLKLLIISIIINTTIYFFIPHKTYNIKIVAISFILTALFLFSSINKNGNKKYNDITYPDAIIIGLSSLFTFIPTISPLCASLFICSIRKLNKKSTIKYSFFLLLPILLINSIPGITFLFNNQEYLLIYTICFLISVFISCYIYDYFSYIYYENKLYKISIYCILLSIFLLFWFR